MSYCSFCGKRNESFLLHRCKYCGLLVCNEHILPENHECKGLPPRSRLITFYPKDNFPANKGRIENSFVGRNRKRIIYTTIGLAMFVISWLFNYWQVVLYGALATGLFVDATVFGLLCVILPCMLGRNAFRNRVVRRPVAITETTWVERRGFGESKGKGYTKQYTSTETKVVDAFGTIAMLVGAGLLAAPYTSIISLFQIIGAVLIGLGLFGLMPTIDFHLRRSRDMTLRRILPE